MKRSNAPVYWSLFGAGGMLSALLGPGLLFVTLVVAMGAVLPPDTLSYARVHAFASNFFGAAFLFVVASLFLWHAAHRIFHTLHDFGIRTGRVAWLACYGVALAGTILSAGALVAIR